MLSRSFLASIGNGAVGGLSGVEMATSLPTRRPPDGGSRKRRDHLKPGPRLDPTRTPQNDHDDRLDAPRPPQATLPALRSGIVVILMSCLQP